MKGISSVKNAIEIAIVKSKKLKESILKSSWSEVVGEMAKKSAPLYIKEGVLFSVVEGSVFLQHMNMNKNNYIVNANKLLKGNYITDMRFKVGKISLEDYFLEKEHGVEEIEKIDLSAEEIIDIKKSCSDIADEELRDRIIHLKEEALKREKTLLKKGFKKCSLCGNIYDRSEGKICRICRNKKEKETEEKVFKVFTQNPYISYEEIEKKLPNLSKDDYKGYKAKKLDKIYRKAYFLIVEKKEEEAEEWLKTYFKLETGNRNEYEVETQSKNLIVVIKEKIAKG